MSAVTDHGTGNENWRVNRTVRAKTDTQLKRDCGSRLYLNFAETIRAPARDRRRRGTRAMTVTPLKIVDGKGGGPRAKVLGGKLSARISSSEDAWDIEG